LKRQGLDIGCHTIEDDDDEEEDLNQFKTGIYYLTYKY
jgi:hypothetical protein